MAVFCGGYRCLGLWSLLVSASLSGWGFELVVLDVGQGDSLLVRHHNMCLWVDFGTQLSAQMRLPFFLAQKQFCSSSWGIVTHRDVDHRGGLVFLSDLLGLSGLISAIPTEFLVTHQGVKKSIQLISHIPHELKSWVEWLWPSAEVSHMHENDHSLVLRVWDETHQRCALLTADITYRVEQALIAQGLQHACTLLKVAHHGSQTSSSEAFLKTLRPKVAVISAGWKNGYGHPHASVLRRLRNQGVVVFRTDVYGQIRIQLIGESLFVLTPRGQTVLPL